MQAYLWGAVFGAGDRFRLTGGCGASIRGSWRTPRFFKLNGAALHAMSAFSSAKQSTAFSP